MTTTALLMFDVDAQPPDNGEAAIGFTLQIEGKPRREFAERIRRATCNEAKYNALISGLRIALDREPDLGGGRLRRGLRRRRVSPRLS